MEPARFIMGTDQSYYVNRPGLLWKAARFILETGQVYYGNRSGLFNPKMTPDAVRLIVFFQNKQHPPCLL